MGNSIRKMAVIGAGTMGAAIAACGARAGLDVVLMVRGKGEESGSARAAKAIDTILKKGEMKGSAEERIRAQVVPADMQNDAGLLRNCDLVIEAVAEDLGVKQKTISFIFENAGEETVVGTNTSNISIAAIGEALNDQQQERFLGIHFFNPVRYMDLVELIPHEKTGADVVERIRRLVNDRFGKSPILCKDAPGFIANRIGSMALTSVMNATVDCGYGFARADALTGDLIFRPKQGAFKLLDLVGLDISVHTVDYMSSAEIPAYEKPFRNRPEVLYDITARGYLGNKTGGGFYRKVRGPKGTERFVWDYVRQEYIPLEREQIQSIAGIKDKRERLRSMLFGELPESAFVRRVVLEPMWLAMMLADEISFDFRDIDEAMRGGYNWLKGPFELCDLLGAAEVMELMRNQGLNPPDWAAGKIAKDGAFYAADTRKASAYLQLQDAGKAVLMENADAVLCDAGDGVALFSLRTKANTYTIPAAQLMLAAAEEVERSDAFRALVVCNPGPNLGAGANLYEVAAAIEGGQLDMLEQGVEVFQKANLRLKYLKKPVVVAARGQALGGSAELMLHAGCVVAHQELYAGLVEMGVGLVPSGGGCAELLFRATQGLQYGQMARIIAAIDELVLPVAQAKYSMSAEEAMKNGYLRRGDLIVPKADALLEQAIATAVRLSDGGWVAPVKGTVTAAGESGYTHLMATVNVMLNGRMMTPYDAVIVEKLAGIFSGGDALAGEQITEEDVLFLERKAFMELCRNEKTLERIKGMVATGKPVRN
ncbi:MAG: enoyl-CoA hydratase/isomerase family protein [Oscillospiraceae bacterium]|nr:enoyl-CoA hydratase/isomerase family protein [Oscillospiraceae bacterium]